MQLIGTLSRPSGQSQPTRKQLAFNFATLAIVFAEFGGEYKINFQEALSNGARPEPIILTEINGHALSSEVTAWLIVANIAPPLAEHLFAGGSMLASSNRVMTAFYYIHNEMQTAKNDPQTSHTRLINIHREICNIIEINSSKIEELAFVIASDTPRQRSRIDRILFSVVPGRRASDDAIEKLLQSFIAALADFQPLLGEASS